MINSMLHVGSCFFLLFLVPEAQVFNDSNARIAGTDGTCREGYLRGAYFVDAQDDCTGQCTYQHGSLSGFDSPFSPYTCQKEPGQQVLCECRRCPCPEGTYGPNCSACSSDSSCEDGQTCDRSGVFSSRSKSTFNCDFDPDDPVLGLMIDSCHRDWSHPGAFLKWDPASGNLTVEVYCYLCTHEYPLLLTIACHSAVHQIDMLDSVTRQITSDSPCKSQGLDSPCVQARGENCQVIDGENLSNSLKAIALIAQAAVSAEPITTLACTLAAENTSHCALTTGPTRLSFICNGGGVCGSGDSQALFLEAELDSSVYGVIFVMVALTVLPLFLLCYLKLVSFREHALIVKAEPVPPELPSINGKWSLHWSGVTCLRAGLPVLDDMGGQLETSPGSGCLVSLMGASGSGKTTLISTLAGRGSSSDRGTVSVCGVEMNTKSRRAHIGYVPQMEVLGASLTVREAIAFSAALRIPHLSGQQRAERVSWVLERLDLRAVADSRIGDSNERGISGGQRRRVAIGTELIVAPMILFLDEPTTGLDAAAALALGKLLRELANEGRLLLCTLHQPRPELLRLFNVQLEIKAGVLTTTTTADLGAKEDCPSTSRASSTSKVINTAHRSSSRCWPMQIGILWRRFLMESTRGNAKAFTSAIAVLGMALVVGLTYNGMDNGLPGVLNRYGSIFFVHMFFAFLGLQACVTWHADRTRFEFERTNNYYSSSAYFLASSVAYVWWYCFLLPLVYTSISYPLVGYNTAGYTRPLLNFLCVCGISCFSSGISVLLLGITGTLMTGIAWSAALLTVFLLFAGFLMPNDRLPELVAWLYDVSPFAHSYSAMLVNELVGLNSVFAREGYQTVYTTGDLWLDQYAIKPDSDDVPHHTLILFIIAVAAWLLALPAWARWYSRAASRLCRIPGVGTAFSSQPKIIKASQHYEKLKQEFFSELMWRDMSLHLRSGKKVFAGLSGCATAQCPLAILGPSGCGKTSLLGLLAGRGPAGGPFAAAVASGRISVDNVQVEQETLRRFVGYVWQDEAMPAELTVREVLQFAVSLGLSRNTAEAELRHRVNTVLQHLELEGVAHSRIGGERKRGISGGERRRTAVAMELVAARPILVLDEPTSGLDNEAAVKLCQLLAKLGEDGHVIVSSLHQPSPEILSQFQKTLVLSSEGYVAYWGTPPQLEAHIEGCCGKSSPADFSLASDRILDLVSAESIASNVLCATQSKHVQDWLSGQASKPAASEATQRNILQAFSRKPSFMQQLMRLFKRECLISWRDRNRIFSHYGLALLMSLLFGYTFQKMPHNMSPGLFGRFGFFYSTQSLFAFQALQCLMAWSESYVGFRREVASGYYCIGAYALTKGIIDSVLLRIGPPLLFGGIVYHFTGMQPGKEAMFLIGVTFTALTSSACCLLLGTLAPYSGSMLSVAILLQLIFLLCNGFLLQDGPLWFMSLSHLRPSYILMLTNELMNIPFQVNLKGVSDEVKKLVEWPLYGEAMLELVQLESADGDNVCKLIIFYVAFMVLSWIVLEARAYFSRPQCSADAASPVEELRPAGNQDASAMPAESSADSSPGAEVLGASSVMPVK